MLSTLPLMAAGLMLGQTVEVPVSPAPAPAAKVYVYSNGTLVPYSDASKSAVLTQPQPATSSSHPILSRIQSWFGKRSTPTTTSVPATTFPTETAPPPTLAPAPTKSNDTPRKMPTTLQTAPSGGQVRVTTQGQAITPTAMQSLPVPASSPILPANANRIGRDEKFEWVTGQLEVEKGQLVLYYATPETVDPHHGRILLSAQKVDLRSFRSGDLISVRGTLHAGHGTPTYQLTSADLIEKAKR
jgi:hypothetical protein